MCYRQWYVDELSPFISSVVRWYISFMPSVERGYVLSSVVRRYISFIVSGTSMNYLLLYHQWYGGISPFMPSVERGYVLSSVVRRYISFIVSGTSMNYLLLYHQWYGGISLSCLQWNVGI